MRDELFTGDEARALIAYLDQHHIDMTHFVGPAKLPIERGVYPVGRLCAGGPTDFYMLCNKDTWGLPFKVWGYFDLRRHEPAPGGELERRRAFRRGRFFITAGGVVRASELTDEEYRQCVGRRGSLDANDADDTFTRQ